MSTSPPRLPAPLALEWSTAEATARGSSHDEATGNQDAHGVRDVRLPDGRAAVVAAVADGHGGRRYVRSSTGSALAVRTALETIEDALSTWPRGASLAGLTEQAASRVVVRWREAVAADVAAHPFRTEEAESAAADLGGDRWVAYGSTLVLAVSCGDEVALAQLGDGDVVVRTGDGAVLAPVPGDARLVAGETTSLCLPGAQHDFRFAHLRPADAAALVVLATDGYGNSFASTDWRQRVAEDLATVVDGPGLAALRTNLAGWLTDSATVGGDDVTVVVLVRASPDTAVVLDDPTPSAVTVPAVTLPARAVAVPPATESVAGPAPARRRAWWIAGICALVVAGAGGALAVRAATSEGPVPGPTPSVSSGPTVDPTATPTAARTVNPSAAPSGVPAPITSPTGGADLGGGSGP